MKTDLTLDNFSGPLDVLLQLVEDKELPITDVALASVTEQFLQYVDRAETTHPEELADFLVIATKLLLIKSAALLPYLQLDDDADPGELAAQLKMYKRYVDAMHGLEQRIAGKPFLYGRKAVKQQVQSFSPPIDVGAIELRQLYVDVLARLEPVVRIPKAALERVVTLRQKVMQIQQLLSNRAQVGFDDLLADASNPADIVVTFMAVLELVKQQSASVVQDKTFSRITLKKR